MTHRHRRQIADSQREREWGGSGQSGGKRGQKETLGAEHIMQCAGDILLSCARETSLVLLPNVTLINSIKNKILIK